MPRLLAVVLLTIALVALNFSPPAWAITLHGQQLFNANCSACHIGGNNIIIAAKTLRKEALEKYGMRSLAAITAQVTNGKNAMPSFESRLTAAEIAAIADYVMGQAEKGW